MDDWDNRSTEETLEIPDCCDEQRCPASATSMMTVRRLLLLFLDRCTWKLDSNTAVSECGEDFYLINRSGHHVVLMVVVVKSK